MSNSGKNIMGQCKTKTYTALHVEDWVCDEVYPACTPLCYKGSFYITKVDDATGVPGKASTADMYEGAFDTMDADFFKAMAKCVNCCQDAIPDTVVGDFVLTNPNDGDGILVFTAPILDGTTGQPTGVVRTITLTEPTTPETDGIHWSGTPTLVDGVATIPTVNDLDESAGPDIVWDLTPLISPDLVAGDNVTVTTNAAGDLVVSTSPHHTAVEMAQMICGDPDALAELKACLGDEVVTYTFNQTNPVDGDGIIEFTVTPSDGGADQFITLPEPTVDTDTNNDWTASALSPAGVLTYTGTDGQGNPIAMPPVDLSALISPMLIAGTGITLDIDPNTGDITVNSTVVDTDTDTWDDVVAVQSTDPDTGVVTTTITVTPAEGGTPVVTTIDSCPCLEISEDDCNGIEERANGLWTKEIESYFFAAGANPPSIDISGAANSTFFYTEPTCVDVENGCLPSWMHIHWQGGSVSHSLPRNWLVQVNIQTSLAGGAWATLAGVTFDTRQNPTSPNESESDAVAEVTTQFVAPADYSAEMCMRYRVFVQLAGDAGTGATIDPSNQDIRIHGTTI